MLEFHENAALNSGIAQEMTWDRAVFRLAVDDHLRPDSRNVSGSPALLRRPAAAAAALTPDWLRNNPNARLADKAMHHALMTRMTRDASEIARMSALGLPVARHIDVSLGRLPSQWGCLRLTGEDTRGENPYALLAAKAADCVATAWLVVQPMAIVVDQNQPPRLGMAVLGGSILGREELILVPTGLNPVTGLVEQFAVRANTQAEASTKLGQVVVERVREVTQILHDVCLASYCARNE